MGPREDADVTAGSLRAEDIFAGRWAGRGVVSSLFNQPLRSFDVSYEGAWTGKDDVIVCEERAAYDHGGALVRSWHLTREAQGLLVGLEASQGGRMRVEDTSWGWRIRYDRLRLMPGPNVTRLEVRAWVDPDGRLHMQGWTRVLGVVPLFQTRVVLTSLSPVAND